MAEAGLKPSPFKLIQQVLPGGPLCARHMLSSGETEVNKINTAPALSELTAQQGRQTLATHLTNKYIGKGSTCAEGKWTRHPKKAAHGPHVG